MSRITRKRVAVRSLLLLTTFMVSAISHAGDLIVPNWELVWNDEFDQASPDTSEWELLTRRDSFNNELQYYLPEQITTSNGNLVITASDQPIDGKQYRSGRMESWQTFGFGRFEARMRLTSGQGYWPAFWLFPNSPEVPWPTGGEIDILENRGSQPHLVSSAYHYNTVPNTSIVVYDEHSPLNPDGTPVNFHTTFNDFTVEWEPDEMRFYVNGVNYHTITSDQVINFATPKNITLNLAVGGFFGGDPDPSTPFPADLLVDYVRVWERPEGWVAPEPELPTELVNGGFDEGNALADWGTFGNSIPNIATSTTNWKEGGQALKMFGQFSGLPNESGAYQGVAVNEGDTISAEASFFTPSNDSLFGKSNVISMSIEFYSEFGADNGSSAFISETDLVVLDGSTPENIWFDHMLDAVAPAGTAEARLVFTFYQPGTDNGAVWVDSASLVVTPAGIQGDFNNDGVVDAADYTVWRDNLGSTDESSLNGNGSGNGVVDTADYDLWIANFGQADQTPSSSIAVPEPTGVLLFVGGLVTFFQRSKRD